MSVNLPRNFREFFFFIFSEEGGWVKGVSCRQEPMTRSLQLYCVRVTAFSQTDLFLD